VKLSAGLRTRNFWRKFTLHQDLIVTIGWAGFGHVAFLNQ